MDSKQDNNKLRPQNEEQLPIELQWENMEANILLKMEALQSAVPSDKKEKKRRRILLFCLLLLGVLLSTLLILNDKPASENNVVIASSPTAPVERTDVEERKDVRKADQLPRSDKEQLTLTQPQASRTYVYRSLSGLGFYPNYFDRYIPTEVFGQGPNHLVVGTLQDNKQENGRAVEQNEGDSQAGNTVDMLERPSKDTPKLVSAAAQQIAAAKQANNEASAILNTDETLNVDSPKSSSLAPVDLLVEHKVIAPVAAQTSEKEATLPAVTLPAESSCPTFKTRSSQLWLTGGASWWSAGYGNTKPERAEFEQAILSTQGQFSYVQPVKKDLFLLVGLQYQQLESRLNWNTQIEDYEITLEDTIIQIRRNAITGATTEIRGDVTLTVPVERKVRHYNSFSLLQVPLGIGKTWQKGSLQSHLLVGGVANLSFSKQGRTLVQAELIDYDDSSSTIWKDKLSFSAMLSGGLSYRINDRLGVMTVVQYQQSLSNWSTEEGITMRPRILNWSLGVNYSM